MKYRPPIKCFWVNLLIGSAVSLVLLLLLKTPPQSRVAHAKWKETPFLFDLSGIVLMIGALVCLLLVLEDGGINKAWSSGFSIGLLVAFLSPNNNMGLGGIEASCSRPVAVGVRYLHAAYSAYNLFLGSLLIGKVGYYKLYLLIDTIFATVLASIGSGLVIQLNFIVAQAVSTRIDISATVARSCFIGGTIGVLAVTNIMNNIILTSLGQIIISHLFPTIVLIAGAAGLRQTFTNPDDLDAVVNTYIKSLKAAWIWSIALVGLAFVISFGAEWRSVRPADVKRRAEKESVAEAAAL